MGFGVWGEGVILAFKFWNYGNLGTLSSGKF